jgi:hypothetical protein
MEVREVYLKYKSDTYITSVSQERYDKASQEDKDDWDILTEEEYLMYKMSGEMLEIIQPYKYTKVK